MAENKMIMFSDLPKRDQAERARLKQRQAYLESARKSRTILPDEEQRELDDIIKINAELDGSRAEPQEVANPLFVGVRELFNAKPEHLGDATRRLWNFHKDGKLTVRKPKDKSPWQEDLDFDNVVKISLVLGLLAADGVEDLPLIVVGADSNVGGSLISVDKKHERFGKLKRGFYAALGEMDEDWDLAKRVLSILDELGDPTGDSSIAGTVKTEEFARVVRCLKSENVKADEPQLERRVNQCLDKIQLVGGEKPLSDQVIELPDLNGISDYEIQGENVRLMGPMICAAMFEELKVFQVVDKLAEMAQNLTLSIGRGKAGELLYKHWRDTPNRMSEAERRNFYALTIGIPGGDGNGMVNREFNDQWIRFVSSVSSLVRQKTVDQLLRQSIPASIGQQQVRKAARDLALNLSSHGYGMALYAAIELQGEIKKIIELLGNKEIMGAFGARDMWQVIDQVATLELDGAKNSARYRTLATCGAIITAWLSNHVTRYNKVTTEPIINLDAVTAVYPPTSRTPTKDPTDYDLVNACELWLADTAIAEDRIEQMSQPRESPAMTSKPVQIPSIAREMLEQAGLPGLGMGMTRR